MAAVTLEIGVVRPKPATLPLYVGFVKPVPDLVEFDFRGLGLFGQSLSEIAAIASNPVMLWEILSQLGRRAPLSGYGKLLAVWSS